ncbi:hypothetical protein [Streptomyces sp. NPDC008121]|uniref:hypothetical protein n=1 Tax=Streptomyces sp. NPDC008121 TaxID=3364809 RepID=UPI0036ECF54C
MKVSEWLALLCDDVGVDEFIAQIRRGAFGEQNSEAELRAGLQRLAPANLIDLDDPQEEDGPLAHLLAERIQNLPPHPTQKHPQGAS